MATKKDEVIIHQIVFVGQDTIARACNKKTVCVPRHPQPNVHIQNRVLSMDNDGKNNSYDVRIVTCQRCLKRIGSIRQNTLRIGAYRTVWKAATKAQNKKLAEMINKPPLLI